MRRIKTAIRNVWMQLKYHRREGYAEEAFWDDRHRRFQSDVRAVGGGSLEEAEGRYPIQRESFLKFLSDCQIALNSASCVEFGSGNGFWANVALDAGAAAYVGFDISENAVRNSAAIEPRATFIQRNLGMDDHSMSDLNSELVLSIDVLQHVTETDKVEQFLRNMVRATRPGGHIVVTSYTGHGNVVHGNAGDKTSGFGQFLRPLGYVASWDTDFITQALDGCRLIRKDEFWDKHILGFQKSISVGS